MSTKDLENLVDTFRQLIRKAQREGDSIEYYRLWEELRMAEMALKTNTTRLEVSFF
jgi:hypothetical protein